MPHLYHYFNIHVCLSFQCLLYVGQTSAFYYFNSSRCLISLLLSFLLMIFLGVQAMRSTLILWFIWRGGGGQDQNFFSHWQLCFWNLLEFSGTFWNLSNSLESFQNLFGFLLTGLLPQGCYHNEILPAGLLPQSCAHKIPPTVPQKCHQQSDLNLYIYPQII